MMEDRRSVVQDALSLVLHGSILLDDDIELAFLQVARDYETTRVKWLHAEMELKKCREMLAKSDLLRSALEVQLKHARNQVDVEMGKRLKAEADNGFLVRQMKSICDILISDSKTSSCLSEEQRSMLAEINHKGFFIPQKQERRALTCIDESSFYSHSDISYDRTDDDLDLDTAMLKPLKSRAKEKRRSSMGTNARPPRRRSRRSGRSGDLLAVRPIEKIQEETTVVRASVSTPENVSSIQIQIDIAQEHVDKAPLAHVYERFPSVSDQTSVWTSNSESKVEGTTGWTPNSASNGEGTTVWTPNGEGTTVWTPDGEETTVWTPDGESKMERSAVANMEVTSTEPNLQPEVPSPAEARTRRHVFLSKTVIRPETCVPCGKRIRFGRMHLKCQDCRIATHPECKLKCTAPCSPGANGAPYPEDATLESFAPSTHPRIPLIITQCVNEIEKRGLRERGIYRVPGAERMVKELKESYLAGKGPLQLSKVADVHVICGLLKDFLRKLKEPLLTFRLHEKFMEASEIAEEDKSNAVMRDIIEVLPIANRNTLAFLMLHLQRVIQSPLCQMDLTNLARVFGPTIVGHSMPEPTPMTIMKDITTQPKVMTRLLSFKAEYWNGLLKTEARVNSTPTNSKDKNSSPHVTPGTSGKTQSTSSLKGKIWNFGNNTNNTSKPEPKRNRFFTSPTMKN
ncbi:rac GTPase-activating protein 1 [Engraulis encrasicolus]|uniref:rac GTPase-activating protein 1 n=1 Tax=Engraulis encrasicolus TaxID=184585 RepID=UPI002FD5FB2D